MDIAVIGCGPVALCSIISAREYKPSRIFAIDCIPSRLQAAKDLGCIPINFKEVDPVAVIKEATENNGVHAVVEGVGHTSALKTAYEIVSPGGKISSFGMLRGQPSLSSLRGTNRPRCAQWRPSLLRDRLL